MMKRNIKNQKRPTQSELLLISLCGVIATCLWVGWMVLDSIVRAIIIGSVATYLFSKYLFNTVDKRLNSHKLWNNLGLGYQLKNNWLLVGISVGFILWLVNTGTTVFGAGGWIYTSHMMTITAYGLIGFYLWQRSKNMLTAMIGVWFFCASYELLSIVWQVYMWGWGNVAPTSYNMLWGFIPMAVEVFRGRVHFNSRKKFFILFGVVCGLTVFKMIFRVASASQYIPELGSWGLIFDERSWLGVIPLALAKYTNAYSIKYVEVKGE